MIEISKKTTKALIVAILFFFSFFAIWKDGIALLIGGLFSLLLVLYILVRYFDGRDRGGPP